MAQTGKQKWVVLSTVVIVPAVLIFLLVFSEARSENTTPAQNVQKTIELPAPKLDGHVSLEKALATRRSIRQFTGEKFTTEQIGQLAWAGQGITEKTRGLRTAPSARASYPIKLYLATHSGLYVYLPEKHALQVLAETDVRQKLGRQSSVAQAGCDIVIASRVRNTTARYGDRADKWALLEAGHIAQNILLEATSMGLGGVPIGGFDTNEVGKLCNLPADMEPVYLVATGYPVEQKASVAEQKKEQKMEEKKAKNAVLIVAGSDFRDEELFETKEQLEKAGIRTTIASSKKGRITGMLGGTAEAAILLNDIKVDDYDSVIFIGGSGAKEYFNNKYAQGIAKQAAEKKKVLGAICIAPTILANAGVLKGVSATSFPSEESQLRSAGAKYTGTDVERDGLIITGSGPQAAVQFGQAIVKALEGK